MEPRWNLPSTRMTFRSFLPVACIGVTPYLNLPYPIQLLFSGLRSLPQIICTIQTVVDILSDPIEPRHTERRLVCIPFQPGSTAGGLPNTKSSLQDSFLEGFFSTDSTYSLPSPAPSPAASWTPVSHRNKFPTSYRIRKAPRSPTVDHTAILAPAPQDIEDLAADLTANCKFSQR
jgi:hypothetical protein